jgi:hypothetical protein
VRSASSRGLSMRVIDWGRDNGEDHVTIETSVGHLQPRERNAVLRALNVFARELIRGAESEN